VGGGYVGSAEDALKSALVFKLLVYCCEITDTASPSKAITRIGVFGTSGNNQQAKKKKKKREKKEEKRAPFFFSELQLILGWVGHGWNLLRSCLSGGSGRWGVGERGLSSPLLELPLWHLVRCSARSRQHECRE
jgi:hypothetical protein